MQPRGLDHMISYRSKHCLVGKRHLEHYNNTDSNTVDTQPPRDTARAVTSHDVIFMRQFPTWPL
jgi:hypothetical protein